MEQVSYLNNKSLVMMILIILLKRIIKMIIIKGKIHTKKSSLESRVLKC